VKAKIVVGHFPPNSFSLQFHAAKANAVVSVQIVLALNLFAQEGHSRAADSPLLVYVVTFASIPLVRSVYMKCVSSLPIDLVAAKGLLRQGKVEDDVERMAHAGETFELSAQVVYWTNVS
jgi:hypothetical protein